MKISELAKLTGISESALRIWELRHGWPSPRRTKGGCRNYRDSDVELVKRVRSLSHSGLLLKDIIIDGLPVLPPLHGKQKLETVQKPILERRTSTEAMASIEKSDEPLKCYECFKMSIHPSDREKLQQYAKDLNNSKCI